jgi:hypothetical protein
MKNLFVLPQASSIYKQLERTRKVGKLNENELESLLFKALFLLEATEAERNGLESDLKWGESEPFWEGQQ